MNNNNKSDKKDNKSFDSFDGDFKLEPEDDEGNDNNKSEQKTHQQSKKIKETTVNKYSQNRKGDLHESILIDNDPLFLNLDNAINMNNNIVDDSIKLSTPIV